MTRSGAANAVGIVVGALVVAGFALGVHEPNLHNGLIAAAFSTVGVFVLHRRPGNREAWLFLAIGAAHAVMFFGRQYGLHHGAPLPGAEWITWIGVWPLALVLALVGVTILSFPDGQLPTPRWRPVVVAMVGSAALFSLLSALWPVEYADDALTVGHPLHLVGATTAQAIWDTAGRSAYLLYQLVWVVGVVVRLRRRRGDEAQQVSWFVYSVALGAVAMVVGLVAFRSPALGLLSVPLMAAGAGIAILKYRLYDIDVVISKSLVVAAMAALVGAVYVAVVVGVGSLVTVGTRPNLAVSLAATAVIAVAFDPARRRVQRWADRVVFGHRPTPYEALSRLSSHVASGTRRDELFTAVASTVAEGVGAEDVTLWVGAEHELVPVASWPPQRGPDVHAQLRDLAALGERRDTAVRPILHRGAVRGAVTLTKRRGEVLTAAEDRLLRDLATQAGLVIDNVGLGTELQERLREIALQATELQAAAKRLVAAEVEARRGIERDLHDGAQQRLVTLALSLQAISVLAESSGDEHLVTALDEARRELADALLELREMARGIHPAILTDEGLEAALSFLAERAPLPVHLIVDLRHRPPPAVEAAAYFVVSEALTNVAKHAAATKAVVAARLDNEDLVVEVCDDGCGGADGQRRGGLQGLADRLATLSGTLTVDSGAGAGTTIRAVIPCA